MTVDCNGKSGGLALLWQKNVDFELMGFSESVIHCHIHGSPGLLFTGVYGCPRQKKEWNSSPYYEIGGEYSLVSAGDLNEILSHREKVGGRVRPNWQLENFSDTLTVCNLKDLEF